MTTTILFDLDGTLLPMDNDLFVRRYLGRMARYMAPYGYDPEALVKAVWAGTGAMVKNDGSALNETVFWQTCNAVLGRDAGKDAPIFEEFYRTEFQKCKEDCGFDPLAAQIVREARGRGAKTVLATNPMFPAIATHSRLRWAGLEPEDFDLVTTYENSAYCKPNPDYYREILGKLEVTPAECLMVGNDVDEDMMTEKLGMRVFLLSDNLINRGGKDISSYPQGGFPELLTFIREF